MKVSVGRRLFLEKLGAASCFLAGFHGAKLGLVLVKSNRPNALGGKSSDHVLPAGTSEVIGEKTAVSDDDTE